MFENLLEVVSVHKANHGIVCVHVEALADSRKNYRENLMNFKEYLDLEFLPSFLFLLHDIFYHEAFYFTYNTWTFIRHD